MAKEKLIRLIVTTIQQSLSRFGDHEWPDDLRARDIVRLLRERSVRLIVEMEKAERNEH